MGLGLLQLRAGGQDVAASDIKLQVPHTASRKPHFHNDVGAVLRRKSNREAGAQVEPRRVRYEM